MILYKDGFLNLKLVFKIQQIKLQCDNITQLCALYNILSYLMHSLDILKHRAKRKNFVFCFIFMLGAANQMPPKNAFPSMLILLKLLNTNTKRN